MIAQSGSAGEPFATVLTSIALNALLRRRAAPDTVVEAFANSGLDQPLIVADEVTGADVPAGLLLWANAARRHGIDRTRTVLIHPSLAYTVPKVAPAVRAGLARAQAVIVAEAAGTSAAVLTVGAEGVTHVWECARVPYTPLTSQSAGEAVRELRQVVMAGLETVEDLAAEIDAHVRNFAWRDWQAELTAQRAEAQAAGLISLLPDQHTAQTLLTALKIHRAFQPILAPAGIQPPQLGALLADLHARAGEVITAVTRDALEG